MLLAALAALLLLAPAADARKRTPSPTLVTRDAVQVLQTGKLTFRVGKRTLTVRLTDANRRRMRSCTTTFITLRVAGRSVRLACRRGFLVRASNKPKPPKKPKGTVYEVGAAGRSINPEPDGTWQGEKVFLGGYGFGGGSPALEGRFATGILGEGPSVRAFVAGDGKTTMVVADMEVQGWFTERRSDANGIIAIRKSIAKATGGALPAERVIVQSDHSHSGADALGVWGGVPKAFVEHMRAQTEAAILDAWFNRRPGELFYGTAEADQFPAESRSWTLRV